MQDCGLGSCFNQPDFKNCKRKVGCKEKKIDKTTNILLSFYCGTFVFYQHTDPDHTN